MKHTLRKCTKKQGVAAQSLRESAQSKRTRTCQHPTRKFMPQTIGSRLIFPRRRGTRTGNVVSTFINSGLHEADCSQFDKDGPDHSFETSQHVLQKGQLHCVYAHKYEVPDEETPLFLRTLQEWMLGTNPVTVALQAEVSHAEYMTADSLRATKFFVEERGEGTFAGPYAVRTRNGCSAVIWRFPQAIPFLVHDQAGPLTKFRY